MVPTKSSSPGVAPLRPASALRACYARVFGEPDSIAAAELDALAPFFPAHPSAELLLLVACSVHHRCAERAVADSLDQRQALTQAQICALGVAVARLEQRRELGFAMVNLVSSVAILVGALYLACRALAEPHGRVVAVMQCTVALVVAVTGARMLWGPR